MRNLVGHKVLLILRNPGGTCRNIYGREQLYLPTNSFLILSFEATLYKLLKTSKNKSQINK
jgi:hypothetical protein